MKKLTREESKNILMSTIGSDMLGCYNDKQTSCVYYSDTTKSYCAIGMLLREVDGKGIPIDKGSNYGFQNEITGFDFGGHSVNGAIELSEDLSMLKELSKHTNLTPNELSELQRLHDRSVGNFGGKHKEHQLKYETFVAKL